MALINEQIINWLETRKQQNILQCRIWAWSGLQRPLLCPLRTMANWIPAGLETGDQIASAAVSCTYWSLTLSVPCSVAALLSLCLYMCRDVFLLTVSISRSVWETLRECEMLTESSRWLYRRGASVVFLLPLSNNWAGFGFVCFWLCCGGFLGTESHCVAGVGVVTTVFYLLQPPGCWD